MKLVILSTDGVLCNQKHMESISRRGYGYMYNHQNQIDKDKMSLINYLINKTQAEVIFSGSWRSIYSLEKLNDMVKRAGATWTGLDTLPIMYKLDKSNTFAEPPDEVSLYFKRLVDKGISITDYVILDDHINDYKNYNGALVKVNYERGLRPLHIEKSLDILGVERKVRMITAKAKIQQ